MNKGTVVYLKMQTASLTDYHGNNKLYWVVERLLLIAKEL